MRVKLGEHSADHSEQGSLGAKTALPDIPSQWSLSHVLALLLPSGDIWDSLRVV